ncbi:DNA polymerase kappa-like [Centruroides sculpturatus]|uniref:DNA polymerase kappa-like n=1 Tax=Centruroides sculpturatus TaxID=218467 RepID=UPI000C6E52B3|nr:DNA polymerase kappa-like [Centruroides sculpturatus]XP_023220670.1 DNA polymerase kappa-like [Centruroides sculpturatus]XP_023220671.1 DNA polymerase kappa-like [Centruroides sculpturatus]XP_023220672.1 DNA polymerase kappa-like [Centruroides sculpturatus]XP_023220673.1 DNA polymerase kappa-like [Centruroides sculpturatus]
MQEQTDTSEKSLNLSHSIAAPGLKTIELNDYKAGMSGLDKEQINRIIYNASKGSPYFLYQEKRQQRIDKKVQEMKSYLNTVTEIQKKTAKYKMDILAKKLEKECDLSHVIVHFDMDAFYAAVEMRDNPEFRDKPIAVGSNYMLSTSNYIARKFGVRAAMPGFIAKKLCHDLIIIPPNFEKYNKVSQDVFTVLKLYDPDFLPMSLDEAYVDITDYLHNHYKASLTQKIREEWCWNDAEESVCIAEIVDKIVNEIRQKIFESTQLTVSAGIAPNMMLAKICSDRNKPNGQYRIPPNKEERKNFISKLPLRKISGIGPVQEQMLSSLGIKTCQDLWENKDIISLLFTPTSVHFYLRVALGLGHTHLKCDSQRKSLGVEETFSSISDPEDLYQKCQELCKELCSDITSQNIKGKIIVLKIKTVNFDVHTRNMTLNTYTSDFNTIYSSAKKLLQLEIAAHHPKPLKLRLMGVRVCNIINEKSDDKGSHSQQTIVNTLKNLQKKTHEINSTVPCPICNQVLPTDKINFHLDQCLQDENEFSFKDSFSPSKFETQKCNEEITDNDKQLIKNLNDNTYIENNDEDIEGDTSENLDEEIKNEEQINYSNQLNENDNCNTEIFKDNEDVNENDNLMTCPICGFYKCTSFQQLNQHIDLCLNKSTVRELVSQTISQSSEKRKKISSSQTPQSQKKLKTNNNCRKINEFFCSQ